MYNPFDLIICEVCNKKRATQQHHKFPQTKKNKKLYPDYIHRRVNIQHCCFSCHIGHSKGLIKWTEVEFCKALDIVPRSKEGRAIYERGKDG
jgi:hypothetical protein